MRDLGEFVLGLDQHFLVGDQVTFRGQRYSCTKFVPRWLKKTPIEDSEHWDNITDLSNLRSLLSGQYGIRLQSTGDAANLAETRIVMQTADASPTNPYVVEFDQFILTPFTGPGQFDLVERDASDVDLTFFDCITEEDSPLLTSVEDNFTAEMVGDIVTMVGIPGGTTVLSYQDPRQVTLSANATADAPDPGIVCVIGGKTQVTIATKSGFVEAVIAIAGWSHFVKAITADKVYSVIFIPGDAGDGIYSVRARALTQEFGEEP